MQVRNLILVLACCLFKKEKKIHSNFFLNFFLRWSAAGTLQQIPLPFQWACYDPGSTGQRHVSGDHGGNEDHGHPRWRADRYEYARNKKGNRPCLEGVFFCHSFFLLWIYLLAFYVGILLVLFCLYPFLFPLPWVNSVQLSSSGVTQLMTYQHSFRLYS